MDDVIAMAEKLPDNMPVIVEQRDVQYSVSKQEYIEMLKKRRSK